MVIPGDVVELTEGMEELYVMGTVNGFQKVTKIDGLQDMASLTVSNSAVWAEGVREGCIDDEACRSCRLSTFASHAMLSRDRATCRSFAAHAAFHKDGISCWVVPLRCYAKLIFVVGWTSGRPARGASNSVLPAV